MMRPLVLLVAILASYRLDATPSAAQSYPMIDRVAQHVVEKYRNSSCQELASERAHPPMGQRAEEEQRFVQALHNDPKMRQEFLNRVAAPIANRLFECGLIP